MSRLADQILGHLLLEEERRLENCARSLLYVAEGPRTPSDHWDPDDDTRAACWDGAYAFREVAREFRDLRLRTIRERRGDPGRVVFEAFVDAARARVGRHHYQAEIVPQWRAASLDAKHVWEHALDRLLRSHERAVRGYPRAKHEIELRINNSTDA